MEHFNLLSSDNATQLYCSIWKPEGDIKAILQITHGMCEYIDRYDDFAVYLNKNGVMVVGDDHLGHGHSATGVFGYFGEKDGWKHLIQDECNLADRVQADYPGIPYILLGHSMGSFIARGVLAEDVAKTFAGAIIMGTSGTNPAVDIGIALASMLKKIKGATARTKLVTIAAFGSYNKRIKSPVNYGAWLSRDDDVCIEHAENPFCKFTFTTAGYEDMFRLLKYINLSEWYEKVPKNVPVLVTSGWEDPVGNYGKGPAEVVEKLSDAGCEVCSLLYEGMRHEILNEIGKEAVYDDMVAFILDASEGLHIEKDKKPFCEFD